MSAGAWSTASFDERGHRFDSATIEDDGGGDSIDLLKPTVRLCDVTDGVEGEIANGSFWWRHFAGHVERTPDDGMMALVTCGRRALLAVTVPGDVSEAHIVTLTGEFFERACAVLSLDAQRADRMRQWFAMQYGGA